MIDPREWSFGSENMQDMARESIGKRTFRGINAPVYSVSRPNLEAAASSFTPFDLLMNPDTTPSGSNWAGITPWAVNSKKTQGAFIVPQDIREGRLSPRGVAVHEAAHFDDPRLNNYDRNMGYMTFGFLQGEKAGAEIPAIRAERAMRAARKFKRPEWSKY